MRTLLRKPASVLDQAGIQPSPTGCRVRLQLDAGHAPIPAVQRRVLDPLPQLPVAAKDATNREPEDAGLGVEETGRLTARAAVTMDEPKLGLAHLPALLHDLDEQAVPDDLGRAITVEVDPHVCCLRDQRSGWCCDSDGSFCHSGTRA